MTAGISANSQAAFPPVVQLSSLDGTDGFRLDGVAAGDFSGYSVSAAGDLNGDDIDDLLIGARDADPNGLSSGTSDVVFGGTDAPSLAYHEIVRNLAEGC